MAAISDVPEASQNLKPVTRDGATLGALTTELQHVKQQLAQEKVERQQLANKLAKSSTCANQSENVFYQLFARSSDAHLLMQGGLFTDCNPAAVEMLGYDSKGQLLSLHPSAISPEYQPDGQLSSEKANDLICSASQQGNKRFEWVHRRLNGEDFWAEVLLVPIELNEQQFIHATIRDIHTRKQAAEALHQKEIQYRSIFESINDGF